MGKNTTTGALSASLTLVGLTGTSIAGLKSALALGMLSASVAPAESLSAPVAAIRIAKQNIERLRRDEYAEQESAEYLVGREFSIEVKPMTLYKDGVLDIFLLVHPTYPNDKDEFNSPHRFEHHPGVELKPVLANERGSYVGENAYGVQVEVSRIDLDYIVLMFVNRPRDSQYLARVRLPGPEAKLLSKSAVFVISGEVAKTESGKVAGCSSRYSEPTIDSPYSGRSQTCWAASQLKSISIVDKRSRRILRQWTPDDPESSILNKPAPIEFYSSKP